MAAAGLETKVFYHVDSQPTPYLVKIAGEPGKVTLADFKGALNGTYHKYFFKSVDDEIGVVKEEIEENDKPLPFHNGRVVAWLVSSDRSLSDFTDQTSSVATSTTELVCDDGRLSKSANSRHRSSSSDLSMTSSRCGEMHGACSDDDTQSRRTYRSSNSHARQYQHRRRRHGSGALSDSGSCSTVQRLRRQRYCSSDMESTTDASSMTDASSIMSSEYDCSSYFESDCGESQFGSRAPEMHSMQSKSRQRRRKHHIPRYESYSSVTESAVDSLNIISVTLDMEPIKFLGISIVGQSNSDGDGGIFVGSVMKGGAVDADGRIGPGDMILQANDVNLEEMTNDEAVKIMREIVQKSAPITLVVAKCLDFSRSNDLLDNAEPIQPIDPSIWVQHTQAIQALYANYSDSTGMSTITSTSSGTSLTADSELPEADRLPRIPPGTLRLPADTPIEAVARHMAAPNSGLDVRDRMWLKIKIPKSFIGSDVVDWLYLHLEGFTERRQARKYASNMLKANLFHHTVHKITFSEQCYYIFSQELSQEFSHLQANDSSVETDTLFGFDEGRGPWSPLGFNMSALRQALSGATGGFLSDSSGKRSSPRSTPSTPQRQADRSNTPGSVMSGTSSKVGGGERSESRSPSRSSLTSSSTIATAKSQAPASGNHSGSSTGESPTGSMASHMSTGTTASKKTIQNDLDSETTSVMADSAQPAGDVSEKERKRLERIAAKLRQGSVSTLNALSTEQELIGSDAASVFSGLDDTASVLSFQRRALGNLPPDLAISQHSFREAMKHPHKFFVSVM